MVSIHDIPKQNDKSFCISGKGNKSVFQTIEN